MRSSKNRIVPYLILSYPTLPYQLISLATATRLDEVMAFMMVDWLLLLTTYY